jgi:hypothetical protein
MGLSASPRREKMGNTIKRDLALLVKLQEIQKFIGRFSNNKSKTVSWHLQALKSAME